MAVKQGSEYAVMADDNSVANSEVPRETSIRAHLVTSISITMSMAEMETLMLSLERVENQNLSMMERQIIREFSDEVRRLR